MTTLLVDVENPNCDATPNDRVYCEIQPAIDAARRDDVIRIHAGTYDPFVVNKNRLTIREHTPDADPTIDATGHDFGVQIDANRVRISGLFVQDADRVGFRITGEKNEIVGNSASNNRTGFLIIGDGNILTNNSARFNTGIGFTLYDSDDNALTGNTAANNGQDGFYLYHSDDNALTGNTAANNTYGFYLDYSHGNALTGNTALYNGRDGFKLYYSYRNELDGNLAHGNSRGFRLDDSDSNEFRENHARFNAVGFSLDEHCEDNWFIGNEASLNYVYGFETWDHFDDHFIGNGGYNNGWRGLDIDFWVRH